MADAALEAPLFHGAAGGFDAGLKGLVFHSGAAGGFDADLKGLVLHDGAAGGFGADLKGLVLHSGAVGGFGAGLEGLLDPRCWKDSIHRDSWLYKAGAEAGNAAV